MKILALGDMPTSHQRDTPAASVAAQPLMTDPSRDLTAGGRVRSVCRATADEDDDLLFDNVPI